MNTESAPFTTTAHICLVKNFNPPDLTKSPLLPFVLNLLRMHHNQGQFHAIMEHLSSTLLLQVLKHSYKEPTRLVPVVRHKGSGILGQFYEF